MTYKRPRIRFASAFAAFVVFATSIYIGIAPSYAYAGTLENGNLAYAQSEFNKGEACNYLPGYETGYDAWHLVLTTRGATFQADPSNPKVSINLNMVFMRTDGSKYVIKSGALVQFGKGAYVYTLTKDKDRIVQAGSLATINGSDSGMRLSHTCPGSGTATYVPTAQPSPTPTSSQTPTPSPTPTSTATTTPTQSPTPVASTTPAPTPTTKFAGTLENGNLALADSEFNKGESCDYLPGFETGYDAWHLVLTTRGSKFIQNPRNAKESIFLNILFQRTDGSRYVITTGAWVQFGKGAYVYTPTSAQDRIVQAGTWAETNTTSSGMRLSHTCPGTKSAVAPAPTPAATPTPTPVATPTPTPVATPTPTPVATPTPAATPTVSPTPVATPTPSVAPTPTPSPSKSEKKNSCKLCTIKSFAKETPRPSESPGPASKKLEPSPTPSPEVTPTVSPTTTPTPSASPAPTATPTASPRPTTPAPTPTASPTATRTPTPTPTPTATIAPAPTPTPTPTPTRTREPEPQLPTIPPVENPRTVVFVTPNEPVVVTVRELISGPAPTPVPITIITPPTFGTVVIQPNGNITYTSNVEDPKSTVVDFIEYRYTDLSGAVIVARKEFLLAQQGDVPRIIQTGETSSAEKGLAWLAVFAFGILAFAVLRRVRRKDV